MVSNPTCTARPGATAPFTGAHRRSGKSSLQPENSFGESLRTRMYPGPRTIVALSGAGAGGAPGGGYMPGGGGGGALPAEAAGGGGGGGIGAAPRRTNLAVFFIASFSN